MTAALVEDVLLPKPLWYAYPPEAVLTAEQVAAWLQISTKTLETLPIKSAKIGHRTRRYLGRHVIEYLERIAT